MQKYQQHPAAAMRNMQRKDAKGQRGFSCGEGRVGSGDFQEIFHIIVAMSRDVTTAKYMYRYGEKRTKNLNVHIIILRAHSHLRLIRRELFTK